MKRIMPEELMKALVVLKDYCIAVEQGCKECELYEFCPSWSDEMPVDWEFGDEE